jgi:hypothetical protein
MLIDNSKRFKFFHALEVAVCVLITMLFFGALVGVVGLASVAGKWQWSEWPRWFSIITMSVGTIVSTVIYFNVKESAVPFGKWLMEIEAGTIVFDQKTGKIEGVLTQNVGLFKDHFVFGERYLFLKITEVCDAAITVHPITSNPKVRNITCHLVLRIRGQDEKNLQKVFDFVNSYNMWRVGNTDYLGRSIVIWTDPIQSLLCDFVNTCSSELSDLYNPWKEDRQDKFGRLVHTYFDPFLDESGIEIKGCSFSVS